MINYLKILILPVAIIIMLGSFANIVLAQTPLSVTFTPDPLFVEGNFLPADEAIGTVAVSNLGEESQTVITEAVYVFDPDNLSSQLHLLITKTSDGATLYDRSLDTFLSGGETALSMLPAGGNETYTFIVTFNDIDDENYQGKKLDFNLCVGFQGGQTRCGGTFVGGEDGGEDGGSVRGFGNSGSAGLIIRGEQTLNLSNVGQSGMAIIIWDTNILSTSQVVYGLASNGPYDLVLTPPRFGYPLATAEDPTKVINHSVLLGELIPGETYVYRVISRASPPTVSFEHRLTVPLLAQAGGINFTGGNFPTTINEPRTEQIQGTFLDISSETAENDSANSSSSPSSNISPNNLNNVAGLFGLDLGDFPLTPVFIFLLILLVFYVAWRFYPRKKD